jgi:hypothetical protein
MSRAKRCREPRDQKGGAKVAKSVHTSGEKDKYARNEVLISDTCCPSANGKALLQFLLKDISIDTFQSEYFEKKPLLVRQTGYAVRQVFTRQTLLDILKKESLQYSADLTVCQYEVRIMLQGSILSLLPGRSLNC